MKFLYGICDFYKIFTKDHFYIDRTDQIPLIEKAGEFERLFGRLAFGKNPMPAHNQREVMNWDFSAVDPQGSPDQIKRELHDHINGCVEL